MCTADKGRCRVENTDSTPEKKKEYWIDWGGRMFGPYSSREAALGSGFHLPEEA